MKNLRRAVLGGLCLLLVSMSASLASPINYGNFDAATVTYINVTEDSSTDPVPLFGAPTVGLGGDTIDFNPIFKSTAAGAGGFDMTDGQLLMNISAHDGKYIDNVTFTEAGDWRLLGAGGTTNTFAQVLNNLFVDIYEVWNPVTHQRTTINAIQVLADMTFSPSAGDYYKTIDPATGVWTGGVTIDLGAALAAHGYANYYATRVSVNLDNTLLTQSEAGTTAYIAKKDAKGMGITADTANVPEPATLALLGLGAMALLRKRSE